MRSVEASAPDDRTARARIRDAAIACFADAGIAGTSVRTIAAAAGVSPALVIHHYGSKDALRVACDRHVADIARRYKEDAVAQGPTLDMFAALQQVADGPPLLRYLARTLADGSPETAGLVDEMVRNSLAYTEDAVRAGIVRPTGDPHGRAVVLSLWSLGMLALHEHVERLLGVDLTGDIREVVPFFRPVLEVYGRGVLTDEAYARMSAQLPTPVTTPPTPTTREDET